MKKKKTISNRKSTYRWNQEIARLREISIQRRRSYIKSAKRNHPLLVEKLWRDYKESKKELTNSIKVAKWDTWKKLCNEVDKDIWGDGYKLAIKMMNRFSPIPKLTMGDMEIVVRHHFPTHHEVNFMCNHGDRFPSFKGDEVKLACSKIKSKKAAVPGLILLKIVVCGHTLN